jgi:UDP-glucose 4-epimerase
MMSKRPEAPVLPFTRALVTGGAGFIGSHIVEELVAGGCKHVVVLDNMVRGRPENLAHLIGHPQLSLTVGDIRDRALVRRLVSGCDVVFHQAALRITHCAAEPREALTVMVDATFDLLNACISADVRKVVYASSASVYGLATEFPTTEQQHPWDNRTLYGAAKAFGEGLLRAFKDMSGLDYVALRYFNVYGPRMDLYGAYTEVLIRWIQRIATGKPPIIFGDGLQTMDFVHVADIARANILAAVAPATDLALNIGYGRETSLVDLARALAAALGRPDLEPIHEAERSVNPVPRRLADVRLAKDAIGFEPQISLEAGLASLVDWWRSSMEAPPVLEIAS